MQVVPSGRLVSAHHSTGEWVTRLCALSPEVEVRGACWQPHFSRPIRRDHTPADLLQGRHVRALGFAIEGHFYAFIARLVTVPVPKQHRAHLRHHGARGGLHRPGKGEIEAAA